MLHNTVRWVQVILQLPQPGTYDTTSEPYCLWWILDVTNVSLEVPEFLINKPLRWRMLVMGEAIHVGETETL